MYQHIKWFWEVPRAAADLECDISLTPLAGDLDDAKQEQDEYNIPCWIAAETEPTHADVEDGISDGGTSGTNSRNLRGSPAPGRKKLHDDLRFA